MNTKFNIMIILTLRYIGNCGYPELSSTCGNFVPKFAVYDNLLIEGTIIIFSCPHQLVLIGPNSSICTEIGQWEPDPSGSICGGYL